eukprot:6475066-Amphidinium_carterae.2
MLWSLRVGACGLSPETWRYYNETNTDPASFIEEHADFIYIVLSETDCKVVMSLGESASFSTAAAEVARLYGSSRTGKALFGSAMKCVAEAKIQEKVSTTMTKLAKASSVTPELLSELLARQTDGINGIEGASLLHGRRDIRCSYGSIPITLIAKSPAKAGELQVQVALRASASHSEKLPKLPCEEAVCALGQGLSLKIDPKVVRKSKTARGHLYQILRETQDDEDDEACTAGDRLKACKHEAWIND